MLLNKAHVLALNTAHVLHLNKADVLALNKAHVLRLNNKICPVFRANAKEAAYQEMSFDFFMDVSRETMLFETMFGRRVFLFHNLSQNYMF